MLISIIIVNYNTAGFILPCLQSIWNSFSGLEHELIVVDNNSSDGSCALIRENFPDLRLIDNKVNLGFGKAVNQGVRVAQGKYFLILNPDVTLLPGSVEKAITFLERNPEVALLLPKLLYPDGSLQFSCRTFPTISTLILRRLPFGKISQNHKILGRHLMIDWTHNDVREVDWGLGACMLIRRKAIKEEYLFDERFFLYFEDMDLCFRLKKMGQKVIYYPEAVMIHHHIRQSAQGLVNRAKWEHFKSLIKFYWKHRGLTPLKF